MSNMIEYFKGETQSFTIEEIKKIVNIAIDESNNVKNTCGGLQATRINKITLGIWTDKLSPVLINGETSKYNLTKGK